MYLDYFVEQVSFLTYFADLPDSIFEELLVPWVYIIYRLVKAVKLFIILFGIPAQPYQHRV
jgi:hypothetical protein